MKLLKGVIFVLFLLLVTTNYKYISGVSGEPKIPNVVVIAVNELGLGDLNSYWEYLKNIRGLSEDGIRFSHVYSQLYTTSSRSALLTGRLPVKTGMLKGRFLPFTSFPSIASSGGLPSSELTLAEILKENGYTNCYIGLWDQGLGRKEKFLPLNHGFDSWFGTVTHHSEACLSLQQKPREEFVNEALSVLLYGVVWSLFVVVSLWCLCFLKAKFTFLLIIISFVLYITHNSTSYIAVRSCVLYKNRRIISQPYNVENVTLRFTDEALGYLETANHKHPFFLMVNHLALSRPVFSSSYFRNFSGRSDLFLDALVELDWSVGSILRKIEHLNLTDDTITIFTALSGEHYNRTCNHSGCHGTEGCCHGNELRGNSTLPDNWENQLQVPLFIKWPKITGHSKTINQSVTLMDIMPTILDLTKISYLNESLDGKSMLGLINEILDSLHVYIFHYLDVTRPSAVTYSEYKVFYSTVKEHGILHHDPPLLFNIRDDPNETSPLPAENFREMISNISEAREKHEENRTRKWISQFEYPILPWLFPCANFPYCHRRDISKLKHIVLNRNTT